jgi:PEP-CTERM motif
LASHQNAARFVSAGQAEEGEIVRRNAVCILIHGLGGLFMKLVTMLLLVACALPATAVHAEVVYRQTFGRPDTPTTDMSPGVWGWADFDSAGAWNTVANVSQSGINGSNSGRPIDVANVNAGTNSDGTSGAYARGIHYFLNGIGTPVLSMTPQFTINPADYQSLKFSWYEGNADATATMQLIAKVGGQWYAGATAFSTAATTLAQFAANAQLKEVTYDPAAANWLILNFDGSYDPGSDMGTNSTTALSLGATPGSDLSGMITAFGLYVTGPGTRRFDTFEIDGVSSSQAVPGDYNGNSTVDAADYTIWRDTLGSTTDLRANGDTTGASANTIDQADYAFWKAHFGNPSGSGSGAVGVPEPATVLLLGLAGLGLAGMRRR